MKAKTANLLKIIKNAKYHKAYNYFIKNNYNNYIKYNYAKYHNIEWYADLYAKSFISVSVEDTINFPERKEVYR